MCLPGSVRKHLSSISHLSEEDWIKRGVFPSAEARSLTLALGKENMDTLENTKAGKTGRGLLCSAPFANRICKKFSASEKPAGFSFP